MRPSSPLFSFSLRLSFPSDCVLCLSAQAQKIDSPLFLPLMFSRYEFSRNDEAPSQLIINRKHIFKNRGKKGRGEASVCVWLMRRDGCCGVRDSGRYSEESWIKNAVLFFLPVTPLKFHCFMGRGGRKKCDRGETGKTHSAVCSIVVNPAQSERAEICTRSVMSWRITMIMQIWCYDRLINYSYYLEMSSRSLLMV